MTNEEFIESIRLDGEEWRDVVGFEGRYMVSSFGRVISLKTTTNRRGSLSSYTVRKLINGTSNYKHHGISYMDLSFYNKENKRIHQYTHRVVATAFIPNPHNYPCVDHIDGNSLNNHIDNLRWCTHKINNDNPITRERSKKSASKRRGCINESQSLKVVQLDMSGNILKIYPSLCATERDGFRRSSVNDVCKGKKVAHKGYKWMYKSDYELLTNISKNSKGE